MNKVILCGRLGKDPELNYTQGQTAVCKFTLATSESYNDKQSGQKVEKTEWHNIVAWNKQGEVIRQYFNKGSQILIEGKIHYNKWQDKEGQNRITPEIILEKFEFIGSKNPNGNAGGSAPKQGGPDDIPF